MPTFLFQNSNESWGFFFIFGNIKCTKIGKKNIESPNFITESDFSFNCDTTFLLPSDFQELTNTSIWGSQFIAFSQNLNRFDAPNRCVITACQMLPENTQLSCPFHTLPHQYSEWVRARETSPLAALLQAN